MLSVTRGSNVTCSISNAPSGATYSNWKFTDSSSNTVTSSQTSSTWSGTIVTTGTVSVMVSAPGSNSATATATIAIAARSNFTFAAASPTLEPNNSSPYGCALSVPSPPVPNSKLGLSCLNQPYAFNDTAVNDSGPNQGYRYVTSVSNSYHGTPTGYYYVISPDLANTASVFT